jgi:hypothetical protein
VVHLAVFLRPVNLFAGPELASGVDVFMLPAINAGPATLSGLPFLIDLHEKPVGYASALLVWAAQVLLRLALGQLALQGFNLVR